MIDVIKYSLRRVPTGPGTVLHRSLRAINLQFSERVVTLLNKEGTITPSSIVLDVDYIPAINKAKFENDMLHTDSFEAHMRSNTDLSFHPQKKLNTKNIRNLLRSYIIPKERSIMIAVLLTEGYLKKLPAKSFEVAIMQEQAKRILRCESVEDAARLLLGIGFGLTPSGDDFILGSIALMHLVGLSATSLRPIIIRYTNALSRTMLLDGIDGYFSQPLLDVLNALDNGSNLEAKILRLEKIGHTSGYDVIAGMYYAASYFIP